MKTLLDLLAAFSELAKISKVQKEQLEAAFNELPADSKSPEITATVNSTLAKFSEDSEGQGAGEGAGAGAGNGEGDGAGAGAGTGTEGAGVAANEGVVSIQASELAALRAAAAKGQEVQKTTLKTFCETSVTAVIAKGSVLPKHKDKLGAFSESLGSVEKAKEFFELIGEFKAFNTTESGHGTDTTPETQPATEQKFSEAVAFYQEKFGFSEEAAKAAVTEALKK